jgi:hypothetical protein
MLRKLEQRPRAVVAVAALISLTAATAGWYYRSTAEASAATAADIARQNAALRLELKHAQEAGEQIAVRLAEADRQLGSTKTRVTATETRSIQLSRELTSIRASLNEREQREVALMAEIEGLRRESAAAQTAAPTDMRPNHKPEEPPTRFDPTPFNQKIAALEAQLLEVLSRALAEPRPFTPAEPIAEATSMPRIVEVGTGDAFAVVDRISESGIGTDRLYAVQRDGVEIARGKLTDLRGRFAIMHIVPGSQKGKLQTGDIVLLAN